MNKKLIALFVAIATVVSISAHYDNCYIDRYGVERCGYRPVEGAVDVTERTLEGTGDVVGGAISGLFGGPGPVERVEERRAERREARREARERRNGYRY